MTDSNERFLFENVEVAVQKGTKQFIEILVEILRTYPQTQREAILRGMLRHQPILFRPSRYAGHGYANTDPAIRRSYPRNKGLESFLLRNAEACEKSVTCFRGSRKRYSTTTTITIAQTVPIHFYSLTLWQRRYLRPGLAIRINPPFGQATASRWTPPVPNRPLRIPDERG